MLKAIFASLHFFSSSQRLIFRDAIREEKKGSNYCSQKQYPKAKKQVLQNKEYTEICNPFQKQGICAYGVPTTGDKTCRVKGQEIVLLIKRFTAS